MVLMQPSYENPVSVSINVGYLLQELQLIQRLSSVAERSGLNFNSLNLTKNEYNFLNVYNEHNYR
jgi:hypothetical protein